MILVFFIVSLYLSIHREKYSINTALGTSNNQCMKYLHTLGRTADISTYLQLYVKSVQIFHTLIVTAKSLEISFVNNVCYNN